MLTSSLYVLLGSVGWKMKYLVRRRIPMGRKWIWVV